MTSQYDIDTLATAISFENEKDEEDTDEELSECGEIAEKDKKKKKKSKSKSKKKNKKKNKKQKSPKPKEGTIAYFDALFNRIKEMSFEDAKVKVEMQLDQWIEEVHDYIGLLERRTLESVKKEIEGLSEEELICKKNEVFMKTVEFCNKRRYIKQVVAYWNKKICPIFYLYFSKYNRFCGAVFILANIVVLYRESNLLEVGRIGYKSEYKIEEREKVQNTIVVSGYSDNYQLYKINVIKSEIDNIKNKIYSCIADIHSGKYDHDEILMRMNGLKEICRYYQIIIERLYSQMLDQNSLISYFQVPILFEEINGAFQTLEEDLWKNFDYSDE